MVVTNHHTNANEVRKAIQVLAPDDALFEVRIFGNGKPVSGYFRSADALLSALGSQNLDGKTVTITLNQINGACASRIQYGKFIPGVPTTSDTDIEKYKFLFIDLDPVRPSGVSSTEEELKTSVERSKKVYDYLKDLGFEEPIKAISGNGAHLLYAIDLPNTEENRKLVGECLNVLSMLFSDSLVEVDRSNKNPARVCKLYGTRAQKGANTEERPHRVSQIKPPQNGLKTTDRSYLERLAKAIEFDAEKPAQRTRGESYSGQFNIDNWLSEHNIAYKEVPWRDGCRKLILDNCPFNHEHKAPDSMVLVQPGGAIGFKCFHASCQGYTWKDFRLI